MNTLSSTCKVCNTKNENKTFLVKEMMYGTREKFLYFQCTTCKCLQINEVPDNLHDHYPTAYYSLDEFKDKRFEGTFGNIKKSLYKASALNKGILKHFYKVTEFQFLKHLNINTTSKILDVGCGNGRNFLHPLAEVGFTNLLGCDPYLSKGLSYDNGLKILKKEVFDISTKWDLITYHHVFEHLENPLEHLHKIYDLLEEDGVCVLRIPTVSSYAWEHYKENWVQLDAPRHLFLHSTESLKILSEKSNFTIDKILYDSTNFQFIGSENYIKDIPLNQKKDKRFFKKLKRKYQKATYNIKAKNLNKNNLGDQAIYILRKRRFK
ncbi:class I SAM-dependent methyltransferase [Patiriisocius marinus]|nr:class I SAM-dependent methyltransferase [Patiriisocius marinus]